MVLHLNIFLKVLIKVHFFNSVSQPFRWRTPLTATRCCSKLARAPCHFRHTCNFWAHDLCFVCFLFGLDANLSFKKTLVPNAPHPRLDSALVGLRGFTPNAAITTSVAVPDSLLAHPYERKNSSVFQFQPEAASLDVVHLFYTAARRKGFFSFPSPLRD